MSYRTGLNIQLVLTLMGLVLAAFTEDWPLGVFLYAVFILNLCERIEFKW